MKQITAEWVAKAEGDFTALEREARARKNPVYDDIGFHSQQCVEKYLKARLSEARIGFQRTHDLSTLLDLVVPVEPFWQAFADDLAFLTDFAVTFRYPGQSATRDSAMAARKICRKFRRAAREALGLEP